ncbi:Lrp/AsnC family transcriptional regulator [Candidatus Woesearchaeota archaeon]|nr:Lrp/AsnC family transcriptional regulator [Candidatus Woesearchaeota archaeon]
MDPNKLRRFLFHLLNDSRITTKQLARLLDISQQTASYTLQKLEKDKTILNYQTIADPAKHGLVNALLLLHYHDFDHQKTAAVKRALKQDPDVVRVEEVSQGADLMVEYCVPNLSYFNKQYKSFLYSFKDAMGVAEAHVVIVKHHYTKNYLHKRHFDIKETITCGDRDIIAMNDKQRAVLQALINDPRAAMTSIAKKTKIDAKTVTATKKWLERKKIIRGYTAYLDHEKLEITREHIFITLSFEDEVEEYRFLEFCKQHKNIITVTKIIGPYDLFITTERMGKERHVINDLRKAFTVKNYRTLISDAITKYDFVPRNENGKA